MTRNIRVAELFAGVGGFRVGLERASKSFFKTVYANQWEPSTKVQHAFDCYIKNFGESNEYQFHDNTDIFVVNEILGKNPNYIKDKIDLLVGGFPCQDYSVATSRAEGIQGKKGVLWWEIKKFIQNKNPNYVLLENVDRLLKSPSNLKGRDFLIMLWVFNDLGYDVEWSVINAAEYGFAQRRKRIFIFAHKRNSTISKNVKYEVAKNQTVLTKYLNITDYEKRDPIDINVAKGVQEISDKWTHSFMNYGFMINGIVENYKVKPKYNGDYTTLQDILEKDKNTDKQYFLSSEQLEKQNSMKDGGKKTRVTKSGFQYVYSEGKMNRWDNFENRPGRTMLTSEGTVNRSTHIIKEGNKFRFLTPVESERLQGFDDNWTESMPTKRWRYFAMGNALVTNVVEQIGKGIKYFENKKD